AGGARPDFILGINAANEWRPVAFMPKNWIVLEGVISGLDSEKARRQRPAHGVGRTIVRTPSAVGASIKVEHVLPGEIFERLHAERFHLIQMVIRDSPSHRLQRAAIQFREVNVEERRDDVKVLSHRQEAEENEEREI